MTLPRPSGVLQTSGPWVSLFQILKFIGFLPIKMFTMSWAIREGREVLDLDTVMTYVILSLGIFLGRFLLRACGQTRQM